MTRTFRDTYVPVEDIAVLEKAVGGARGEGRAGFTGIAEADCGLGLGGVDWAVNDLDVIGLHGWGPADAGLLFAGASRKRRSAAAPALLGFPGLLGPLFLGPVSVLLSPLPCFPCSLPSRSSGSSPFLRSSCSPLFPCSLCSLVPLFPCSRSRRFPRALGSFGILGALAWLALLAQQRGWAVDD